MRHGVILTEVGGVVPLLGDVAEAVIGSGQDKLAELLEIKGAVCTGRIILFNDVHGISNFNIDMAPSEEVNNTVGIEMATASGVNQLECF
jgi:hypothetical protein